VGVTGPEGGVQYDAEFLFVPYDDVGVTGPEGGVLYFDYKR
jgi:hypothetical protein